MPIQSNNAARLRSWLTLLMVLWTGQRLWGADPDLIGISLLRAVTTNLNGAGIRIAQAEAPASANPPTWEVNPAAVGLPVSRFTYTSSLGTTNVFPNNLGAESDHADAVGSLLYGLPGGLATNVTQVRNYEADYFYNSVVRAQTALNTLVVNQSFIFESLTVLQQQATDTSYDNYAARYNVLFVSGVGNGGQVYAPATCYNGIGVAAYGGASSVGPTLDNGRAKPDLTAPAGVTSFSTPLVTGAAAVLLQASLRGDGGSDTNAAADSRTIKALLLNGAVKPADWTRAGASPLDTRYGAGVLNLFNAYFQLTGGKHGYQATTSITVGDPHPPPNTSGSLGVLRGWDFNTNSSSIIQDGVNHYFFDLANGAGERTFTATLVWKRQQNHTAINDLDLFLYDALTGGLVAASTSAVDNVEHLFVPRLPAGRYDLQVLKGGGALKRETTSETYALAFDFFSESLSIAHSTTNVVLTWPLYPAGFFVETANALPTPPDWASLNAGPSLDGNQNRLVIGLTNRIQFFRLRRP